MAQLLSGCSLAPLPACLPSLLTWTTQCPWPRLSCSPLLTHLPAFIAHLNHMALSGPSGTHPDHAAPMAHAHLLSPLNQLTCLHRSPKRPGTHPDQSAPTQTIWCPQPRPSCSPLLACLPAFAAHLNHVVPSWTTWHHKAQMVSSPHLLECLRHLTGVHGTHSPGPAALHSSPDCLLSPLTQTMWRL